jgi:dTDP-4-dehydrorhamnose 3,5-epimerase-like enzyme
MNIEIKDIPKISDPRGNIGVLENGIVPFDIKRVYYLYDVPSDSERGGHAHKKLYQFLIAISGSFDVHLDDGKTQQVINLNKPDKGVLIKPGIWRELKNFSGGSVCLVLASEVFDEADYIREYNDFKLFVNSFS